MFNILKSDFYKLKKSKTLYICLGISLVMGILLMVAMQQMINAASSRPDGNNNFGSYVAGGATMLESVLSQGLYVFLIAVFVSIFISSEFHYGTIKNTLSRGSDRTKVFLSKLIVSSCVAVSILLVYLFSSLITGTIIWGYDPAGATTVGGMIGMIFSQILLTVCYTAFFVFISMTLRSSGGTIATNVLCVALLGTLLSALNSLFGLTSFDLNNLWLGGALSRLASLNPSNTDIWQGIVVGVSWAAASLVGGIVLFRKRDVK